MSAQRVVGLTTLVLLGGALLVLLWAMTTTSPSEPPELPGPPEQPAPPPVHHRSDAPELGAMHRRALPTPPGVTPAKAPPQAPPAQLSAEEWRDYNSAVHDIVRQARGDCLRPYAREAQLGTVEVILDAVLWDGRVVDFGIRGLQDVPDHVLDCVAEVAWSSPMPEHDIPGELRLQRAIPVDGR